MRWIIHIFSGISALLFVVFLAAAVVGQFRWVNSRWSFVNVSDPHSVRCSIRSNNLVFEYQASSLFISADRKAAFEYELAPPYNSREGLKKCVFRFPGGELYAANIALPHWLLLITAATTPAVDLVLLCRRRRKQQLDLCRKCGYDLRASPERCPECGTPIGRTAAHA